MNSMFRSSGSLGNWRLKCDEILLDPNNDNPFPKPPIAANFYNNPPQFCYGRDEQINEISDEILSSINSFEPKLIRILGKQGIGKSTLICWGTKKLSEQYPLPIVYLETSGQPEDFKMKSLYRQIISKIEKVEIINELVINSIKNFIKIFKNAGGTLYNNLYNKFSGEEIENLVSSTNYIKVKINDITFNQKIFELANNNAMLLSSLIPIDLTFLLIFWKSHVQNPEYLLCKSAFKGDDAYKGFNIQTDGDASKYIDEFIELIRWSLDQNSTLVLIFDHLEAGTSGLKEKVYSNLFSLLLNLRQKKYLTIILSGTLDAYNEISKVLEEDQDQQLDNWAKTIALTNLDPEVVIRIIDQYFAIFWSFFNYRPSPDYSLYPFGKNSINYLYSNNGQDLRRTLKNVYELIEKYRKQGKIEKVDTFFKAFKSFRQRDDMALSYIEQKELIKKLLDKSTQDKNRSTNVELALCKFFEALKNHPDYDYLTDVRHEPVLGPSKKKPDVYLEFFGKQGLDFVKSVGIEVKIYRIGTEIAKKDIKKTYILLEEKVVDYVMWITNVPLDIRYRYDLPSELKANLGRFSPLDDLELAYIAFMVCFEEIFGITPTVEQAEFILNRIDLSPIMIKEKLLELPKLTDIPKIPKPPTIDITSFGSSSTGSSSSEPAEDVIHITPEKSQKKKKPPISSVEVGMEQILESINKYIEKKSREVTKITSAYTIKEVKHKVRLSANDITWDEDIWAHAIDIGKKAGYRTTTKTIFFQ